MPWQPPQGLPALLQYQPPSFQLGGQGGYTSMPPGFLQYLMAQHYAYQAPQYQYQQPAYQYQAPNLGGGLSALQQYRTPQLASMMPPNTAINSVAQPAQASQAAPQPDYNSFNWAG